MENKRMMLIIQQLIVLIFFFVQAQCLFGQTFTFSNYNSSPGAGSTSNYSETNSSVTMTVATSTVGTPNWESARCGGATPRYVGSNFSPCMSPKFGLVWGLNWTDKNSTVTGNITFNTAVSCLSFTVYDINRNSTLASCANVWTDVVEVTGFNGATPVTPNASQSDPSQQTITLSGNTRIATANEASLGDGVTFSFSSPVTRVVILYKSGSNVSSTTGCPEGSTNPAAQFIVIGTITGGANFGTLAPGNQAACPPLTTNPITFSSLPVGATAYQWYYKDGLSACPSGASMTGWVAISGATGTSYTPPSPAYSDRTYACFVTTGCGSQWATGCRQIDVNTSNATSSPALSANDYLWVSSASQTITIDSEGDPNCVLTGFGSGSSTGGWHNGTARFNGGTTGAHTASAVYTPNIPQSGVYEVYFSVVRGSNRAADVPFVVNHAGGTSTISVNQTGTGFTWTLLGTFTFNAGTSGSISIRNGPIADATKLAMADAIRFVQVGGGSTDYELASNWLQWTGSGFQPVSSPPSTNDNVFIKPIVDCVYESPTVDNLITVADNVGSANSKNITICAGAVLNFSSNNSHLHINGNYKNEGTVNPSTGRVKFIKNGTQTVFDHSGTAIFYEVNIGGNSITDLLSHLQITNALRLNGVIQTNTYRTYLNNESSASLVNFSGHIFGNFRRDISTNTDVYKFPMGVSTSLAAHPSGGRRLLEFLNNNITGVSYLDCSVSNTFKSGGAQNDPSLDPAKAIQAGQIMDFVHPEAQWRLTPNSSVTSGNYGVRLYVQNFTSLDASKDNKFIVLKRQDNSLSFFDFNSFESSTVIPAPSTAGRIFDNALGYAERTGFTAFSEFVIASNPTPLPVKLNDFIVKCNNTDNVITWSTLNERNNDYFTIEYSPSASGFSPIAYVVGSLQSNSLLTYSINHTPSFIGNHYYRLYQTDLDGSKEFLAEQVVNNTSCAEKNDLVSIFHNGENIQLQFNVQEKSNVKFDLYDGIGKLIFSSSSTYVNQTDNMQFIPINNLASGVYFIQVELNDSYISYKVSL